MEKLIIPSKTEKKSRTSLVINLADETKAAIDRLALDSGSSFNEIVEMLFSFALPYCAVEESTDATPAPAAAAPEPAPTPAPKPAKSKRAAKEASTQTEQAPKRAAKKQATVAVAVEAPPSDAEPTTKPKKTTARTTKTSTKAATVEVSTATKAARPKDPHTQVATFKLPPLKKK